MSGKDRREAVVGRVQAGIAPIHDAAVAVYDRIANRGYSYVGQRSYGNNDSARDVLDTVQAYNPPDHGEPVTEYADEIHDLLDHRVDRLDAMDDPTIIDAARCQVDESAYFAENLGALAGGVSQYAIAAKEGFAPYDLVLYAIGAPMILTSPAGLNNLDSIRRFRDEFDDQREFYRQARDIVAEQGPAALNDDIKHKFHLPIIGTWHIKRELDDGIYYDITQVSDEDRPAVALHAAAEGYEDLVDLGL